MTTSRMPTLLEINGVEGGGWLRGVELDARGETTAEWDVSICPFGDGGARGKLSMGGCGVDEEGHGSLSLEVEEAGTAAVTEAAPGGERDGPQ
jgi:hypothetical protein